MTENEKTPADAANIDGGIAGMVCRDTLPVFDSTKRTQGSQGICGLLLHGEANAITAAELARITGRTPREITRAIQRARLTGKPICASGAGFYIASDSRELTRYVRGLDRRLREIRRTRDALGDVLAAATGQTRMED